MGEPAMRAGPQVRLPAEVALRPLLKTGPEPSRRAAGKPTLPGLTPPRGNARSFPGPPVAATTRAQPRAGAGSCQAASASGARPRGLARCSPRRHPGSMWDSPPASAPPPPGPSLRQATGGRRRSVAG